MAKLIQIEIFDEKNKVDRIIKFSSVDVFEVESKTKRGSFYTVRLQNGGNCECPHYKFRLAGKGGICDHLQFLNTNLVKVMEQADKVNGVKRRGVSDEDILEWFDKQVKKRGNWIDYQEAIDKFGETRIVSLIQQFELSENRGFLRRM